MSSRITLIAPRYEREGCAGQPRTRPKAIKKRQEETYEKRENPDPQSPEKRGKKLSIGDAKISHSRVRVKIHLR